MPCFQLYFWIPPWLMKTRLTSSAQCKTSAKRLLCSSYVLWSNVLRHAVRRIRYINVLKPARKYECLKNLIRSRPCHYKMKSLFTAANNIWTAKCASIKSALSTVQEFLGNYFICNFFFRRLSTCGAMTPGLNFHFCFFVESFANSFESFRDELLKSQSLV